MRQEQPVSIKGIDICKVQHCECDIFESGLCKDHHEGVQRATARLRESFKPGMAEVTYGPSKPVTGDCSEGVKHDQGKPDLSMISWDLVEAVARVRMFGAAKYSRSQWKKGFKVTRSIAAALRHLFKFLAGETLDPESKLPHLAHAVCSIEHAIYDMNHHPENDDRDNVKEAKSND